MSTFFHGAHRNSSSAILVFKSLNIPTSDRSMGKREGIWLTTQSLSAPVLGSCCIAVLLSGLGRRQIRSKGMNQNLSIGLQAGSQPGRGEPGLPAASSPLPLTHHRDSSTSGAQPVPACAPAPAEPCSRSLRGSHPCAALDRQARFLLPLSPSHLSSTRNSGERRAVQASLGPVFPNPRSGLGVRASPGDPGAIVASDQLAALH